MRIILIITCFMIVALGLSCADKITVSAKGIDSSPSAIKELGHGSNEILVRFKPDTDPDTIKIIQDKYGLVTVKPMSTSGLYLMKVTGKRTVKEIIYELKKHNEVMYVEPNHKYRINTR